MRLFKKETDLKKQYRNAVIALSGTCIILLVCLVGSAIKKNWPSILASGMFFAYFFGALVTFLASKKYFLGEEAKP